MIPRIETPAIEFYDTTLRDGAQTVGVKYTVAEKRSIIASLDRLGVDFIECGWPGANPTDNVLLQDPPMVHRSELVAFGMTRRKGNTAANDPTIRALTEAKVPNVCLVGKSSSCHVQHALNGTSRQDNLDMIVDSIGYLKQRKKKVFLDAEHFFDGYKQDRDFTLSCALKAYEAGAEKVVLCDTNGGILPSEVSEILVDVARVLPLEAVGVHFHNDLGLADAASLLAAQAGVGQIQGTIAGLGERCGNANLSTLLPLVAFKSRVPTNVRKEMLTVLPEITNDVALKAGVKVGQSAPFVGENAFTHKAGLHASAVGKDGSLYEHIDPRNVGRSSKTTLSSQAGLSNLRIYLKRLGVSACQNDGRLQVILDEIKQRECDGENVELNTGSIDLLIAQNLFDVDLPLTPKVFDVRDTADASGRDSRANVELFVGKCRRTVRASASGIGSVDALSNAMESALAQEFPDIPKFSLLDYSADIGAEAMGSRSRVQVQLKALSTGTDTWQVVATSSDILTATWDAFIICANRHLVFQQLRKSAAQVGAQKAESAFLRAPCSGGCNELLASKFEDKTKRAMEKGTVNA
ncbi:2-isopropylmalate synthase [Aliiroseovarius crassostreae]|uniref:(R)-citramalate synthase n=1 Tax=Aliiroseovarius crassostreae TaxID=154981 RepID=A0A0P7I364_9RHOB|nr:alpha-isopropylmalate synthase regulatory domain-containing protein [Aliiroseovarius crassostreae]KPN63550.1 hypothetical protein AKJ29_13010 [Aliiroseovarius crassostreae]SFU91942.1 2-isopropylmalate synthase [Aliiroseovarius crassostreae]